MSLRSLGYLLTRRFYAGKIYKVQAEPSLGIVSPAASVSAAGRPGRSLHTLRDLAAGDNAFGAVVAVAAALAGGLGILVLKKHPDDAGSNVTNEDTKEASRKTEVTVNKPMQVVEVTDMEKREEARFREWMKRRGKVYPNQEEERKRFEIFKANMKWMDALRDKPWVQHLEETPWADMTVKEARIAEQEDMIRFMKDRARKLIEQGKLNKDHRCSVFPEEQEREQKMKEEGSLRNCSSKQ